MRLARLLLAWLAAASAAVVMLAAPASAAHPERPSQPYSAYHLGAEACTWYETSGEVAFPAVHQPEVPTAVFAGYNSIFVADPPPGGSCPSTPPGDRVIEFTAYVDGVAVAEQALPFQFRESYQVELTSETGIDYVTVAVCAVEAATDRCGRPATVYESGPAPSTCVYDYRILNDWGSGWQGEIALTPMAAPAQDWLVVITLPEGTAIRQGWKAQISWIDDEVRFTPPPWSGPIPVGGSFGPGFLGTGPIPSHAHIAAYVNGARCDRI
jgi:hypothetical protein